MPRLSLALTVSLISIGSLLSTPANSERAAGDVSESEALAVHARVLTIDTHVDIGSGYATHVLDPGGLTPAQVDLPKMRAGGLDAAFFIVYVGQGPLDAAGFAAARAAAEEKYQAISRMARSYPGQIGIARTADEVEAIHADGRRVALIGMENAYPLGESIADVPLWAERGVRYMSLTHMGYNQFGGSSNPRFDLGDDQRKEEITQLGRQLVAALNEHSILIDVSHVGKATMLEAIELSRAPVIASHSGVKGVFDNPRNLDDEQLDAIRDNGGVAQMVAFRGYVAASDPRVAEGQTALRERFLPEGWGNATQEQRADYRRELDELRQTYPDVTVAQFIDHIDYAVSRIGVEHVGIVSDFDGGGGVAGWDDASETANVTRELMRRGYSEDEIRALWGGNVLRILRAAEAVARGDA